MSLRRLAGIPRFAIDEVAARAGSDDANNHLPFTGRLDLCAAVAIRLECPAPCPPPPTRATRSSSPIPPTPG